MTKPNAADYEHDPKRLRLLLAEAGITQTRAAELLGITPRTMRKYLELTGKHHAPYAVYFAVRCLADAHKKPLAFPVE